MFIHDLIKIHLSREGYLPDYPPHLISDEEMCDAFLPYNYDSEDPMAGYEDCMDAEINYFRDTYPLPLKCVQATEQDYLFLKDKYKELVSGIAYHLNELKMSKESEYVLPNWIYNYMLGQAIGPSSDQKDRHYLFVMLGTDNLDDDFNLSCCYGCYNESLEWLSKVPSSAKLHRPASLFGEMHVIKSLRLKAADINDNEVRDRVQEDLTSGKQVV